MDPQTIGKRIKQSYPQYANVDEATLGNKYLQKYGGAVSGIQSGKIKLTDIPEAQRVGVSLGIEAPVQSEEITKTNEVRDTIGNIDTILKKNLGVVTGKSSVLSLIPGTEWFDTRKQVQQVKDQLSLASVGKLKGQGQVSDAERKMLANASSALDVGMTEKAFREELRKVKGILSRNVGDQETQVDEPVIEDTNLPRMAISSADALTKILFPGTRKALSSEGMAIANPFTEKSGNIAETKGNLGESLKATGQDLMKFLGLVAPAGVEIGVAAKTLPKIITKGKGAIEGVKTLTPKGAIANRTAVATKSTAKLSGENIIKAGEEYVTNDPTAKKLLEKILPSIEKKTFNAPQLLEKLKIWNKAYTAAGKVGKSSKAGLYETLARAAREELAQKAPDVLEAQGKLAKAMGRSKTLSKIVNPTSLASAGVTAGTFALLSKLLGLGRQQQ
jgi:hypothetical protein